MIYTHYKGVVNECTNATKRKEKPWVYSHEETRLRSSHLGHWLVDFLSSRQSLDAVVFV